ncbi:MAG: hypothetical protein HKN48_01255 [Flavobacteriaceae bacterium]|nr:hypothetical protein [Flavobacteriaceae bacterium]
MHPIQKILFSSIFCCLLISCNNSSSDSCGSAWLGGEIINPKKDYIILSQSRQVIDTVPLDENNFFMYQIDQVEPGIFFIVHNEYQALFIEPGDSLMLRVNTIEFDESLFFTGKGADKNNLMMELFLQNEKESAEMPAMYLLPPPEFEAKLDSLKQIRAMRFEEFIASKNPSSHFKKIIDASIKYDNFSKRELYLSANSRKKVFGESVEIPANFLDYRKEVDLGSETLRSFYPYYRYLSYYLDNLAFEEYKGEEYYNRDSFTHNYIKSAMIDSLITNDSLKNSLLRTCANRYFLKAKDEDNERKMLDQFLKLSTNKKDHKEIEKLAKATIQLTPGHKIPNLMLLTAENTVKDLHSTFNGPTVLYFWSSNSIKHYKKIHTRASELKSKYPEYNFIGINLDTHFKKWLKIVKSSGYDELQEYQFENIDTAEMKLVINSVNKAMIVDGNGMIINGNTNIFDLGIENELLASLNQ